MSTESSFPAELAKLPDGSSIKVLNSYEASFVIKEIFQDGAYPIEDLPEGSAPVVIDIGANIGIFVRYCLARYPEAQVLAFEPGPRIFELLSDNTAAYSDRVTAVRCGISDSAGEAEFTYYPNYSILSGFKAAAGDDEKLLRSGIATQLEANPRLAGRVTERHVAALADGKLADAVTIKCPLQTLSHFIDEHHLPRVDYLKIDAERCELPILKGIRAEHWPLIRQLGMELHESASADADVSSEIQRLLKDKGFDLTLHPSAEDYPRTLLLHAKRTA
jgi:FkbM family methyltransferase